MRRVGNKLNTISVIISNVLLLSGIMHSQVDSGQIQGTVTDPQGAAVAAATVILSSGRTGALLTEHTNNTGSYVFPRIAIGAYAVTVEAPGFAKVTQSNVMVNIQQSTTADFALKPGSLEVSVDVTAASAQLQTEDASIGNVVEQKTIADLPLNGRNYTFLAQLSAGVNPSQQDRRGLAASGGFSSNGTPPSQNNYLLDGVDNNTNLVDYFNGAYYVYLPSVDSLQEFNVQTSNVGAEFGRSGGAVLNATSKSGTETLHGSVFEFFRNDALDARNYFETGPVKAGFHQNQFGFTLGGPLQIPHIYDGRRNKTFFFVDYQGTRIHQAQPTTSTVPTVLERSSGYTNLAELISGQSGAVTDNLGRSFPLGQVFDPSTTRAVTAGQADPVTGITATGTGFVREPFNNNQLPASRLDANAIKLLSTYPAPNLPGLFNNYYSDPNLVNQVDQGDIRIDHVTGDKGQVFGRASYLKSPTVIPAPFNTIADGGDFSRGNQLLETTGDVLGWTYLFSPTLVNEMRGGYSHVISSRVQPFASDLSAPGRFGIQGIPQFPQNGGLPNFNISGLTQLGSASCLPTSEIGKILQFTDNLTKVAGVHNFKGGFQFSRTYTSIYQPCFSRGSFFDSGFFTEVPDTFDGSTGLAQLLLTPTAGSVPGAVDNLGGFDFVLVDNAVVVSNAKNYYGLYAQDDWRLTRHLTLNLGLRWEFSAHGIYPGGRAANFVPPDGTHGTQYLMPTETCNKGLSPSFYALTAKDGIAITCTGNSALLQNSWDNLAPRVGLAYQIRPNLVMRAAYGIFYGSQYGWDNMDSGENYPFYNVFSFGSPDSATPLTYPNGQIATLENGLSAIQQAPQNLDATGLSFSATQYNYHNPYNQEFNLSVESQLSRTTTFTIAYVGNQGRHLRSANRLNQVTQLLPPSFNRQQYVAWPDFGYSFPISTTDANSGYNSLQTTFQRRMTSGLSVLANYTFSKCRMNYRDSLNNNSGSYRAPDVPGFGPQHDWVLCDYNNPQVFHLSGVYQLPIGKGKLILGNAPGFVDALVGKWTANTILTLQDGQPFTVLCTTRTAAGLGCYADVVPGVSRYGPIHNVKQWANPAAFANPAVVTQVGERGFAALGGQGSQLLGPGFHRMDFSLLKEIPIKERFGAEFRAEFFNLFNTPQFALPSFRNFDDAANFGKITSTRDGAYDQREVQFAVKLQW